MTYTSATDIISMAFFVLLHSFLAQDEVEAL